jgi:hypothetical protein
VEQPLVEEKLCAKCRSVQPQSDFYPDRHSSDGLQSYCKACMRHRLPAATGQVPGDRQLEVTADDGALMEPLVVDQTATEAAAPDPWLFSEPRAAE